MIFLTGATGGLGSALAKQIECFPLTRELLAGMSSENALEWCQKNLTPQLKAGERAMVIHTATDYGRLNSSKENLPRINETIPMALLTWVNALPQGGGFINTDTSLPDGVSDYSQSKARFRKKASELVHASKKTALIHLKLEHLYGPGMGTHNFVTHVASKILSGVPTLELTEGKQLRDFIFVQDAVDAFLSVLQSKLVSTPGVHALHVGSGKPVSIRNLVEQIRGLIPESKTQLQFGALPYRPGEPMESTVDLKAISQLGWSPRTGLNDGLRQTVKALKN